VAIQYSFGWQPSLPDIRDLLHAFQPRRHLLAALPPSVDLDSPSPGPPFDPVSSQGSLGSCGPSSAQGDILHALQTVQGVDSPPAPSRLFIYYNTRVLMGTTNQDSGVNNRNMLQALARWGWCDESLWPYDPQQYTRKPPPPCFEQAAKRLIIEYQAVAQDLQIMKACLAGGDPIIFGFTVYSSMQTPAVESTGNIPLPTGRDQVMGGHDVVLCGYDDSTQRFKLRNSWGPGWGKEGYGTIPYAYATHPRLSGDFWTVKKSPWPDAPPPPPPPPPDGVRLAPVLEARDEKGSILGKYILAG
jgi:C1A family cysteine protease